MAEEIADPFAEQADVEDPFARPEDVQRGGAFEPRPYLADLAGRLVAMVPRVFESAAEKPKARQKPDDLTEERYTVDMIVLDGGELRFWYNSKKKDSDEMEPVEAVVEASEIPKLYAGVWRTEGNVIGQLKKIDGKARPILLGRVRRGPQKAERDKGITVAQIEEAHAAWVKRNRSGPQPKFTWIIDVDCVTDSDRALAGAWYTKARQEGFTL
jgi:hypothetical protein